MYPDLKGEKLEIGYNAASFTANGSQGVLLLHHFNESGKRAEVVPVQANVAEPLDTSSRRRPAQAGLRRLSAEDILPR